MLLNLLNLYSLIFALFSKIEGMSKELYSLQPNITMNDIMLSHNNTNMTDSLSRTLPMTCFETPVPCLPCNLATLQPTNGHTVTSTKSSIMTLFETDEILRNNVHSSAKNHKKYATVIKNNKNRTVSNSLTAESLVKFENFSESVITVTSPKSLEQIELERLRGIGQNDDSTETNEPADLDEDTNYDIYDAITTTDTYENNGTFLFSTDMNSFKKFTTNSDTTENQSTFSVDDTSAYIDSESTSSKNGITHTPNPNLKMTPEFSTMHSSILTDLTDTTYSMSTFTVNEDSNFTNSNSIDTESTNTRSINTESSISSVTFTDPVSTDYFDLTTSSKMYTPTEETTDIISTVEWTTENFKEVISSSSSISNSISDWKICPDITFNCTTKCGEDNITQIFYTVNCTIVDVKCYVTRCNFTKIDSQNLRQNRTNVTMIDTFYIDNYNRKMYNLTVATRKKLLKLCWETMFGQELVKLTMMDLVFVLLGTLFMDFFRALFVRYMNRCWCWDLEKKFPEYGDFKIAENILHLINNQGMVWMGMFFSPGLVVLNVFKLMIMMYLRSWAVMTCNVPHEVVFRVSKSNNFYLALLLTMLFLCVLPVGYTIVWVTPSWHCGPFSEYQKIYYILTTNIYKILPESVHFALGYTASPATVIPLLVLLILIIYYLTSLTNSLREANNDLKIQLRRERTEERRKMFQLADTRRRAGSSAMDNTPFARWKKALPTFPISKSIDSDDRKAATAEDTKEPVKPIKRKGGIFAKIVGLAIDKKTNPEASCVPSPTSNNADYETDTVFHESLPKEVLTSKDISINKPADENKKSNVEFKPTEEPKHKDFERKLKLKLCSTDERVEKKALDKIIGKNNVPTTSSSKNTKDDSLEENEALVRMNKKQTSETSNQSKQSDSMGSVIPVITISTTESDDETLQNIKPNDNTRKKCEEADKNESQKSRTDKTTRSSSDSKSLQRQSSVDSIKENKSKKEKKSDDGHKYQYSL